MPHTGLGTHLTLRKGIQARDQLASLLVASQCCRCGNNSAAGVLGPVLVRQLWDTWGIGTERKVVVAVTATNGALLPMAVRFGVSIALMGMTTDVHIACIYGYWVDYNLNVMQVGANVLRLSDATTGGSRELVPQRRFAMNHLCMNGKWWLQIKREGHLLVVTNLQGDNTGELAFVPLPKTHSIVKSMSFCKLCSSQSLMIMKRGHKSLLFVVDIARTYATKSLQIVSSTQCTCGYFADDCVEQIILMKNKAEQNVFVVEITIPNPPYSVVFAVQQTGVMSKLMNHAEPPPGGILSQLSSSLFSLCTLKKLDIWDCNDTALPLRTLQISAACEGPAFSGILSGNGLICLRGDNNQLLVTEATSGVVVASIDFLQPGWDLGIRMGFVGEVHEPRAWQGDVTNATPGGGRIK
ncbi:hypothetical protein Pelo_9860 [Pelomyxa schiedti]|nr:hypothetical protein Pelo_9860 [Pelomyxa schiedti]